MFRIIRIFRYSKNARTILNILKRSRKPLMAVGGLAVGYVLLSSIIVFNVEPHSFDTFFDAMIRAGKKIALVAHADSSMAKIFLEREMDYFVYPTVEEISAKTVELIQQDQHDVICVYHDSYDTIMHKFGPESIEALSELRANVCSFAMFSAMIENQWKSHNTLVGFAMDHGCHEIDGGCGAHGLDMPEDLNIKHLYKAYPAAK